MTDGILLNTRNTFHFLSCTFDQFHGCLLNSLKCGLFPVPPTSLSLRYLLNWSVNIEHFLNAHLTYMNGPQFSETNSLLNFPFTSRLMAVVKYDLQQIQADHSLSADSSHVDKFVFRFILEAISRMTGFLDFLKKI